MRILDKYIVKELAGPFIFGICAFSSIFIGTDVLFKMARFMTEQGAAFSTVAKLFVYRLPSIIVLTFPMSMLLASLLTFSRLSGNSEIVAMKTGGVSFSRLITPVIIVSLCVSILAMVFNELVVPAANLAYTDTVREEIQKDGSPGKTQDNLLVREGGAQTERITFARRLNGETKTMQGIDIQEFDEGRLARIISAEQAAWDGKNWELSNGIIYEIDENGNLEHTLRFQKQSSNIRKNPTEVSKEQKKPEEMTIEELKLRIKVLDRENEPTNDLKVKLHERITFPLASLIFTLIGAPLGLQSHRASSSIGLGQSIIIIFVYYAIMMISDALGANGTIPPALGAWTPNIIMILCGFFLIHRASR